MGLDVLFTAVLVRLKVPWPTMVVLDSEPGQGRLGTTGAYRGSSGKPIRDY